ncbi:UNVERIFIED_CONTAM: hypothetical protein HDU68_008528 [Siphonaria sp. JEL0065]|nr:hypothetical protein HDU68_008528 [Siphonaria sp. JEL0065]
MAATKRRNMDSIMGDLNRSFIDFMSEQQDELTGAYAALAKTRNNDRSDPITVSDLLKKKKAVSGYLSLVYPSQVQNLAQLPSLPWVPRFFVLFDETMYLFPSGDLDESSLDSFELSASTFVLPKLHRVNAPLAFEVVETQDHLSWLLRAPNQAAHMMWVTLINKAIEQASIRVSLQPPPRHTKINSKTEFALQNYFKSMGPGGETSSAPVFDSGSSEYRESYDDPFVDVLPISKRATITRDDSAFGLSSYPNDFDSITANYDRVGLELRSIRSRKSLLRRNSDITDGGHLSQELEDAWKAIALPVRKSQLVFSMDGKAGEKKEDTEEEDEELVFGAKGNKGKDVRLVPLKFPGRSQSERTPAPPPPPVSLSNLKKPQSAKLFWAKKWFGF